MYNKLDLVEKGIAELSKRMTTQTLDRQIERQMIAEIDKIKKSRPMLEEIEELRK